MSVKRVKKEKDGAKELIPIVTDSFIRELEDKYGFECDDELSFIYENSNRRFLRQKYSGMGTVIVVGKSRYKNRYIISTLGGPNAQECEYNNDNFMRIGDRQTKYFSRAQIRKILDTNTELQHDSCPPL